MAGAGGAEVEADEGKGQKMFLFLSRLMCHTLEAFFTLSGMSKLSDVRKSRQNTCSINLCTSQS